MPIRSTQKALTVILDNGRQEDLDRLVEFWSMDQKKFIAQALSDYSPSPVKPSKNTWKRISEVLFGKGEEPEEEKTSHLTDTELFVSPNYRYKITGESDDVRSLQKIFEMELTSNDAKYLKHALDKATDEVYVPEVIEEIFRVGHRRHHRRILIENSNAPKCPFYLILGPTGSGKSKTIKRAIERAIFNQDIIVKQKVDDDLEAVLKKHPVMGWLDLKAVAPEIAERQEKEKRRRWLKFLSHIPFLKSQYKEETADALDMEQKEFDMSIDIEQINPQNVQTMWYGETGNKIEKAFGPKKGASIRIFEEVHALWGEHKSLGAEVQEDTLVSATNTIMDEIDRGERNCMVVALTRKGEEFHEDIYRRFLEKGMIIDMSDYWANIESIDELIQIEVKQQNVSMPSEEDRGIMADKILEIFKNRGLDLTPAYVRKLVASIAEEKKEITPEFFDDGVLVRRAFVNVARNLYPKMFKKTYNKMQRDVNWDDYVGDIKEEFQRRANNRLLRNISAEKGVILAGPPGVGKTYLARAYLSRNKDIADVTVNMEDLQDEKDPIDGPVKNIAQSNDIAKMCAPCVYFVDEGDAIAMERTGDSLRDRVPNKVLNMISGENETKGVFYVLTTNNPQRLAEAVKRSGRLRVMPMTGKFCDQDVHRMVNNYLRAEGLTDETKQRIYSIARKICFTPADYAGFMETILECKNEELGVIRDAAKMQEDSDLEKFIESNYKELLGVVESLGFSKGFVASAKKDITHLVENKWELWGKIKEAAKNEEYGITIAHIERAKEDRIQAPKIKGTIALTEHLESKLSEEPQVGFVIGAGADDVKGLLVPISSSLIYSEDHNGDKIDVTGAVSVNAEQAAELNASVEMAKHSSKEAFTLVLNYLDSLLPDKDVKRIIGRYLKDRYLHHQFLTATYMSGGPSAGIALAINTLSVILDLPVRHDFGITGAPWSRGKNKKDSGSSVIIGGAYNKSQIVLSCLERMYVPIQNLEDIDLGAMQGYWRNNKDVIGYNSFSSLVGEVYCGNSYSKKAEEMFLMRVEAKQHELIDADASNKMFSDVRRLESEIRSGAEDFIKKRLLSIEQYVRDVEHDEFASLELIFEKYNAA